MWKPHNAHSDKKAKTKKEIAESIFGPMNTESARVTLLDLTKEIGIVKVNDLISSVEMLKKHIDKDKLNVYHLHYNIDILRNSKGVLRLIIRED